MNNHEEMMNDGANTNANNAVHIDENQTLRLGKKPLRGKSFTLFDYTYF
jgi:hypothetical protein